MTVYMVVYSEFHISDVECKCYGIYSTYERAEKIADALCEKYDSSCVDISAVKVNDESEVWDLV